VPCWPAARLSSSIRASGLRYAILRGTCSRSAAAPASSHHGDLQRRRRDVDDDLSRRPTTLDERRQWFENRVGRGYPVLVATDGVGTVVGFASFGDFRIGAGYRFTVEHTVHVRGDRRGAGLGTALMRQLIEHAAASGKHVMIGGVDAGNEPSIRFHERLGFEQVARLNEVGFKFGRWLDLVFLQRRLQP
jgi:phosphinothricin acetyltransferase